MLNIQRGSGGGSKFVQEVSNFTSAVITTTNTIPFDNTKPQSGEGVEVITKAIVPASATNLLEFVVTVQASNAAISAITAALFQDSGANAIFAATTVLRVATDPAHITFVFTMTAGTTSSTTFKVRVGGNSGATTTINGQNGTALFDGTMFSGIVIREVTP